MVLNWTYEGTCTKPTDLPANVLDEWEQTLLAEMTRIKASLDAKIITPDKYVDRIADASSDVYELFGANIPAPWNKDIILLKQRLKLEAAKDAWVTGVTNAFKAGGAFPINVTAKKDKFKLARFVMGAVGHRASATTPNGFYYAWGPVSMGVLCLRGDTRVQRYLDNNDTLTIITTLKAGLDVTLGPLITPSIIAKAIQAVMLCKYAGDANWSEANIDSKIVTPANNAIGALVTAGTKAGEVPTYALDWIHADKAVKVLATETTS